MDLKADKGAERPLQPAYDNDSWVHTSRYKKRQQQNPHNF